MVRTLVAGLLAVVAGAAYAAEVLVEAVQSPAWLERAGTREPLAAGMSLRNGDRVVSGTDGRIHLRLAEGSAVKLGEEAQLAIDRLSMRREQGGSIATAALDVLRGAFRFTTPVAARFKGRREVDVRFVTVTAGIRGTDFWGKSAPDRDIVCLIEGRISVQRQGDAPITMDQALSFYIAPRGQAALPIKPVPPEQLAAWAAETEIAPGRGGARRDGRWSVHALDADDQAAALAAYDALRAAGYPARIRPVEAEGRLVYQVRVPGLATEADAEALATRLRGLPGLGEARARRG